VGAGIGGLTAAAALAQRGVEVEVVEIRNDATFLVSELSSRERAAGTRSIGVLTRHWPRVFGFSRISFTTAWRLMRKCPSEFGPEVPSFNAVGRPDLHRSCCRRRNGRAPKITYGVTWETLDQGRSSVTVPCQRRRGRLHWSWALDGLRSALRSGCPGTSTSHLSRLRGLAGDDARARQSHRPAAVQGDRTKAGLVPLSDDLMYLLHVTPEEATTPRARRFSPFALVTASRGTRESSESSVMLSSRSTKWSTAQFRGVAADPVVIAAVIVLVTPRTGARSSRPGGGDGGRDAVVLARNWSLAVCGGQPGAVMARRIDR